MNNPRSGDLIDTLVIELTNLWGGELLGDLIDTLVIELTANTLLIDREDQRVGRRVEIEAHDIVKLLRDLPRKPLRLSSLVILREVARMFRCAT